MGTVLFHLSTCTSWNIKSTLYSSLSYDDFVQYLLCSDTRTITVALCTSATVSVSRVQKLSQDSEEYRIMFKLTFIKKCHDWFKKYLEKVFINRWNKLQWLFQRVWVRLRLNGPQWGCMWRPTPKKTTIFIDTRNFASDQMVHNSGVVYLFNIKNCLIR